MISRFRYERSTRCVTCVYVIITTKATVENSAKLAAFNAHKVSRGFSVLVVTETDFDALTGQGLNHRAEKIREWLITHYAPYFRTPILLRFIQ